MQGIKKEAMHGERWGRANQKLEKL